jgi:predicted MPP superfamily phosphohydrolase
MRRFSFNRRRFLTALFLGTPAAVAADALWWEPEWVKTRRLRLGKDKPTIRFVHFTDVHHKGDRRYLEGVVRRINKLEPQFVCFTGDIVEESEHLAEALEIFREIRAPLYGVPGNHDFWSRADFATIRQVFAATGGAWLEDRSVSVKDADVCLHGLTGNEPHRFEPSKPAKNLVLVHYPLSADILPHRADLTLAGHSHGGQVRIPFFGPLIVPFGVGQYDLGKFETRNGPLYVSSGIGWFYAGIRFNCRPEVVLVEM